TKPGRSPPPGRSESKARFPAAANRNNPARHTRSSGDNVASGETLAWLQRNPAQKTRPICHTTSRALHRHRPQCLLSAGNPAIIEKCPRDSTAVNRLREQQLDALAAVFEPCTRRRRQSADHAIE